MSEERRRYFRINETVGISYHLLEGHDNARSDVREPDVLSLVSEQDHQINHLLLEVEDENPKVAQLVRVFNLKLERVINRLLLESNLVGRIAYRIKEANISACGIAFLNDEAIDTGARLEMELTLFPTEKKLITNGIVISSDLQEDKQWYWRVDFYGMSEKNQETLIQHVVQCQSLQIKNSKDK